MEKIIKEQEYDCLDDIMLELIDFSQEKIEETQILVKALQEQKLNKDEKKKYSQKIEEKAREQRLKLDELIIETDNIKLIKNELNKKIIRNLFHDLKTPICNIECLANIYSQESEPEEYITYINESNNYQKALLDTSKKTMNRGREEYKFEIIDLKDIMQTIEITGRTLAQKKELEFITNYNKHNMSFKTDKIILERILNNLLTNAIKYTDKGAVEIGSEQNETTLTIYVKDTGPGIRPYDIPKIFNPYYQSIASKYTGIEITSQGLGLAITKEHIEGIKGELNLKTEEGKGSTFYVTLPL